MTKNKHGEMFKGTALKSLARGDQFLRKPDATKVSPWAAPTRANDIVLCYLSGQPVKAASNKYSKKS